MRAARGRAAASVARIEHFAAVERAGRRAKLPLASINFVQSEIELAAIVRAGDGRRALASAGAAAWCERPPVKMVSPLRLPATLACFSTKHNI